MTLKVLIDWAKNGNYTNVGDDVTTKVRGGSAGRVSLEYGRDLSTPLAVTTAGRGSLTLDNRDRRYSPRNTSSPLYPNIKPARPVTVQRTVTGTTYTLFVGHTDAASVNPSTESQSVDLALVDSLADFRGITIYSDVLTGLRTSDAIAAVLALAGWTGPTDLDPGATLIPIWWEHGTDAFEALERLVSSEGPPALLTIDETGAVVFRDRHHRLLRTASTTSQATYRASGVEPVMTTGFRADEAWSNIVNTVNLTTDTWARSPHKVMWTSPNAVSVPGSGGHVDVTVLTDEFFTDPIDPVQGIDFQKSAGSNVSAAVIGPTSGTFTTIRFTGGVLGNLIRGLRLRARTVDVAATTSIAATDSTSVTDYGVRSLPGTSLGTWGTPDNTQDLADLIVSQRAQPLTQVTARFAVGATAAGKASTSATRAKAVLARDLSDRVTVVEPDTFITGDFFVERIGHDLTGEDDHVVTITAEAVPPVAPTGAQMFVFDSAGRGFDQGRFAR